VLRHRPGMFEHRSGGFTSLEAAGDGELFPGQRTSWLADGWAVPSGRAAGGLQVRCDR